MITLAELPPVLRLPVLRLPVLRLIEDGRPR
jgi:hypothetical protein